MSTTAHYHPRNIDIDLADLTKDLYREIASLRGQIAPPPAPPVITCLGNGEPMYVYRHEGGRYFARHYPSGNPNRHSHVIATMSDEHCRQAEYTQRAASDHGLTAALELSTGNGTRLDVAVYGASCNVGFEIQRSRLSRAKAKSRAYKSFHAGWPTAWISDHAADPDWMDHVPAARIEVRAIGWSEAMPPRNTARVIISDFTRERDRSKKSGWRYVRTPRAVLLDDLAYLMPAGEIQPVTIGAKNHRAVVLAPSPARELIDSCTYPGASAWVPTATASEQRTVSQEYSLDCRHRNGQSAPAMRLDTTVEALGQVVAVDSAAAATCLLCDLAINPTFGTSVHFDCARKNANQEGHR